MRLIKMEKKKRSILGIENTWLRNMPVIVKMIMAFAVVLVMFMTTLYITWTDMNILQSEVEFLYDGPFMANDAACEMKADYEGLMKYLYHAVSTDDPEESREAAADARRNAEEFEANFERLHIANGTIQATKGDQSMDRKITEIENSMNTLAPLVYHAIDLAEANKSQEAYAYLENTVLEPAGETNDLLGEMLVLAQSAADGTMDRYTEHQAQIERTLLYTGIVVLVVIMAICYFVSRLFNRPIKQIAAAADEMSRGNLRASLNYYAKDELGQLADSMRTMMQALSSYVQNIDDVLGSIAHGDLTTAVEMEYLGDFAQIKVSLTQILSSLNDTLGQIHQASEQVASGSEQVSSGAQALSQGATEQASSVEELAASISEISEQVKNNAENASEANKLAAVNGNEITNCNRQMEAMVGAMRRIDETSKEINKITKTIQDIAFQTNILSLNAAVEAARAAGQAGKSFAVVASEVGNLAKKSQEAAANTTVLIEESLRAVGQGTEIAEQTQQSLSRVVESAQQINVSVDKISDASSEQANAISQITVGIDQISAVVQTNSATAEESAAASEELSSQSSMLKELVGRFTLRGKKASGYTSLPGSGTGYNLEYTGSNDKYSL